MTGKKDLIKAALEAGDKPGLIELGINDGGFLNDKLRRLVWPEVTHGHALASKMRKGSKIQRLSKEDCHQVMVDVERAQFFSQVPAGSIKSCRTSLSNVIFHVLDKYEGLHYFQGFHQVCSVLLLILGEKAAKPVAESIALFWLRDSMFSSIDPTLNQLNLLMPLLRGVDKELGDFLGSIQGLESHFCISQVLTWLSHNIDAWIVITRFFDLFLVTNPLMPIYVVAATLLIRKQEILEMDKNDFSMVHWSLSKFGASKSDMEEYIQIANVIYNKIPPHKLQRISGIYLGDFSAVNTFDDIKSIPLGEPFNSTLGKKRITEFANPSHNRKILRYLLLSTFILILALNWKRVDSTKYF